MQCRHRLQGLHGSQAVPTYRNGSNEPTRVIMTTDTRAATGNADVTRSDVPPETGGGGQ